jgi:hypothetical protein
MADAWGLPEVMGVELTGMELTGMELTGMELTGVVVVGMVTNCDHGAVTIPRGSCGDAVAWP